MIKTERKCTYWQTDLDISIFNSFYDLETYHRTELLWLGWLQEPEVQHFLTMCLRYLQHSRTISYPPPPSLPPFILQYSILHSANSSLFFINTVNLHPMFTKDALRPLRYLYLQSPNSTLTFSATMAFTPMHERGTCTSQN